MTTRTTHRSTAGKKLYAVRGKDGRFKDVQRYKRAHGRDQSVTTVEEATRVLVREARAVARVWDGYNCIKPLQAAIWILAKSMRAAAKARSRGAK